MVGEKSTELIAGDTVSIINAKCPKYIGSAA